MIRRIIFSEGEYYHVYNRGVEKRIIFLDNNDRKRFQTLLYLCNGTEPIVYRLIQGETLYKEDVGKKIVATGAYTLMPNHFHLLIREVSEGGVTEFMRKLTTAYTMYFNKKYDRVGPLFQGAFKAEHVTRDEHLKYLFAYIHLNIIKLIERKWREIGIKNKDKAIKYLEDYSYSSYQDYTDKGREEVTILTKDTFPEYFLEKHSFKKFVEEWLTLGSPESKESNTR